MTENDLTIVIPAAGINRQMTRRTPRAALPLDNQTTIFSRQVSVLRETFPEANIVMVVGYASGLAMNNLPPGIQVVANSQYADTNDSRSVYLGMMAAPADTTMVVNGDLAFTRDALDMPMGRSSVLVRPNEKQTDLSVGVAIDHTRVENFAYGLPSRWGQIISFQPREQSIFLEVAQDERRRRYFFFELLNEVITEGGTFWGYCPKHCPLVEVDTERDYEKARQLHRRHPPIPDAGGTWGL